MCLYLQRPVPQNRDCVQDDLPAKGPGAFSLIVAEKEGVEMALLLLRLFRAGDSLWRAIPGSGQWEEVTGPKQLGERGSQQRHDTGLWGRER